MRSLTELDPDALQLAHDSAGVLLKFRAYTPPGGLFVMILSKFRDDIRDMLGMEPQQPTGRGRERYSLDELTSIELDTVSGAVGILLDRFTDYMDDPALPRLLGEFREALRAQKAERAEIFYSIKQDARALWRSGWSPVRPSPPAS